MAGGILTRDEIDALMTLFSETPGTKEVLRVTRRTEPVRVRALRKRLEALAARWSAELKSVTGHAAKAGLRQIVKTSRVLPSESEVLYRCGDTACYLVVGRALVNLVNEKSLGALASEPLLRHPLTSIDRALFETTGRLFAETGELSEAEALPEAGTLLEARFDIEIEPLLRTTVRLLLYDQYL